MKHKYRAVRTERCGIKFDSKLESEYYDQLLARRQAGQVVQFLRQVPFHLPGGVRYVCDFLEFWDDGSVHFIDVKGVETREFIAKQKMVEELYAPIQIEVIRKVK